MGERVAGAVDAGDATPLRTWLAELGVDVARAKVVAGSGVPQWLGAASEMTGPWDSRRDVHFWTTGILALPLDKATVKDDKDRSSTTHQQPRLVHAAAVGLAAGRTQPDALWWDAARLTHGDVGRKMIKAVFTLTLDDGSTLTFSSTLESELVPSPEEVGDVARYLGAPKA